MSTSRWLAWTPSGQEIEKVHDPEPTKPTEPSSVSFVSATPALFQRIEKPATAPTPALPTLKANTWAGLPSHIAHVVPAMLYTEGTMSATTSA
jgi:hypothetical protein